MLVGRGGQVECIGTALARLSPTCRTLWSTPWIVDRLGCAAAGDQAASTDVRPSWGPLARAPDACHNLNGKVARRVHTLRLAHCSWRLFPPPSGPPAEGADRLQRGFEELLLSAVQRRSRLTECPAVCCSCMRGSRRPRSTRCRASRSRSWSTTSGSPSRRCPPLLHPPTSPCH